MPSVWAGWKQCCYFTHPLVPNLQSKNITQHLSSAHHTSKQGFQMGIMHQRQPCRQPPRWLGFFTSLSITSPPFSSKVIFSACLLISGLDKETSTPSLAFASPTVLTSGTCCSILRYLATHYWPQLCFKLNQNQTKPKRWERNPLKFGSKMYRTIAEEPTDIISTQEGLFGWSCITCAASILCTLKNT